MTDGGRHPRRHGLSRISRKITGRVYVVHLDEPLGGPKHQARHYKGTVKAPKTAQERLQEHKDGKPGSAAILRAANERGIGYHIVCDWPGNPHIENQIKLYGATRICPECTPDPRVPLIVRAAIKAEKRQAQRAARKEAQAAATAGEAAARLQMDPYEDGRQMARQWLAGQHAAGRSAAQIEATHEYITGPWREMDHHTTGQADRFQGYEDLITAALGLIREAEAEAAPAGDGTETGPAGPGGDEMEEQMQEYDADATEGGYDADVDPDIEAAADLADADVAREAFEAQLAPPDRAWLQETGERYERAGGPGYDADGNAAAGADYDADAAQYEHDPGSWLARDGDGRVLEVDAEGHPGAEASPDDGRPVAEAAQEPEARAPYPDHGWAVTDQDGRRLAAVGVTGPGGERFTTWSATERGARVAWPEAQGYKHELISDREAEAG